MGVCMCECVDVVVVGAIVVLSVLPPPHVIVQFRQKSVVRGKGKGVWEEASSASAG